MVHYKMSKIFGHFLVISHKIRFTFYSPFLVFNNTAMYFDDFSRGVTRTQSNIYDVALLEKKVNDKKP